MSPISRRSLLTSGAALSASSLLSRSAWARAASLLADEQKAGRTAPREQLLFDFGWKFSSATAPIRPRTSASDSARATLPRPANSISPRPSSTTPNGARSTCPTTGLLSCPSSDDERADVARLQAPRPTLSRDQRRLVPPRIRNSRQRAGPPHLRLSSMAHSASSALRQRMLHRPQRQRLRAFPLRPHGLSRLSAPRTTSSPASMPALAMAGSTRAPAFTAMSGSPRPMRCT